MTVTTEAVMDPRGPSITRQWMAHLGYTPEEIAGGEADRDHSKCDSTSEGWDCEDEEGRSRHPIHDEMDVVAELVMFTLNRAAESGPWAMPEIPARVNRVVDRFGREWWRSNGGVLWTYDGYLSADPPSWLMGSRGPLAEVPS